jgi:hypothetical protein
MSGWYKRNRCPAYADQISFPKDPEEEVKTVLEILPDHDRVTTFHGFTVTLQSE